MSDKIKFNQIIGLDPGPSKSAVVTLWDGRVHSAVEWNNAALACELAGNNWRDAAIACEWIESFGMPVGWEVFETVYWIGRFDEAAGGRIVRLGRKDVKLHLCQSMRAKDPNVRQSLLDKFAPTGGGKTPQVGTKKHPGPLYGVSNHCWAALAVAVTFDETVMR